jgi:lyso-ornithine lipid O-acyltransferase
MFADKSFTQKLKFNLSPREFSLRGPLPLVSRGLNNLKKSKQLAHIVTLIGMYAGSAALGKVRLRDRNKRLGFFSRNIGVYTRQALKAFNFEVEVIGYNAELMKNKKFLLVGNHMSYLDIFVLSAIQPCVFVTSVEMQQAFFLGDICELGGCIFIERRTRTKVDRDIGAISETLRGGHHVVIYPEGTSSDGEKVLPFKKSLLMSAVHAGVDVMPIVLKYTEVDGQPFSRENRDKLCWYGDMSFAPHFLGLFKLKKVKAELHFLDPIEIKPDADRRQIAELAYTAITNVYGQPFGPPVQAEQAPTADPKQ